MNVKNKNRQDIAFPIPNVHKMFCRYNMLDEVKHVRKQKGWKNAHQNFDPEGPSKRKTKVAREIAETRKALRPRVYTPPEKNPVPRWVLTGFPDYSEPDWKQERKGEQLNRQIAAAEEKLEASKYTFWI